MVCVDLSSEGSLYLGNLRSDIANAWQPLSYADWAREDLGSN